MPVPLLCRLGLHKWDTMERSAYRLERTRIYSRNKERNEENGLL